MQNSETVIADIPKNSREVYRVTRSIYKGYTGISVRIWWRDGDDEKVELRPSKRGVWIGLGSVEAVLESLQTAIDPEASVGAASARSGSAKGGQKRP